MQTFINSFCSVENIVNYNDLVDRWFSNFPEPRFEQFRLSFRFDQFLWDKSFESLCLSKLKIASTVELNGDYICDSYLILSNFLGVRCISSNYN